MAKEPVDVAELVAVDPARAARVLDETRAATLAGQRARVAPRPVIGKSWERLLRGGLDPEQDARRGLLAREEVERRRAASPLRHVLPALWEGLLPAGDAAPHVAVVADAEGRVLWREGGARVLRRSDGLGFEVGADWREDAAGTNGVGTVVVLRRPVQVFGSEHFLRAHASWTCAGAPVTDPRDGRLLGVVNVSGPLETMHPASLAWVGSVARLAEAWLRELHMASLERLRAVAAPVLARLAGRVLVVDADGRTAAVTGMPYTPRIPLPKSPSAGLVWLPEIGLCSLEPLADGWLVRAGAEPAPYEGARIVLDLTRPRRCSVTVLGDGDSWTHELSPRHAELLYLLAVHRSGRSASQLAGAVFGDPARKVTVRAEMSRVRRYLGPFLEHRPYRFGEDTDVELLLPDDPADLLPHSAAPAVRAAAVRGAVRAAPAVRGGACRHRAVSDASG
ncbi:GAF domain-containing protein [Streptomyces sp. NPDC017179]|uniref:helix-turn-helix domain-containing protein n=1 Tax=Streptomyces sp. NPDC017179 TaxID=3364979 RepID=UPI0037B225C4